MRVRIHATVFWSRHRAAFIGFGFGRVRANDNERDVTAGGELTTVASDDSERDMILNIASE